MIDVEIEDPAWSAALPDAEQIAMRAADASLAAIKAHGGASVLLTNDGEIADLNVRFRGKGGPTNVLSFPAPATARPHLGDIALAYGVCAREAASQGKTLADHLTHLVAHGVLHLVGYDHQTEAEAEAMEALERSVLAGLGVADPYAERGRRGACRLTTTIDRASPAAWAAG
ncbi:MAG: rRNA maturation RNase YbeY [Caulobacteraceae bacterium]